MSDVHDVIEAFIDGEYVDPPLLKQALSEEAGRELLVELLVLRGLVAGQPAARPAAADAPRIAGVMAAPGRGRGVHRGRRRVRRVSGGTRHHRRSRIRPPSPARGGAGTHAHHPARERRRLEREGWRVTT